MVARRIGGGTPGERSSRPCFSFSAPHASAGFLFLLLTLPLPLTLTLLLTFLLTLTFAFDFPNLSSCAVALDLRLVPGIVHSSFTAVGESGGNVVPFNLLSRRCPMPPKSVALDSVVIRTAYDGLRSCPTIVCTEDLTRQGDAAECDIRHIMKRYETTGVLPVGRDPAAASFVDNASAPDFEAAQGGVAGLRGRFSLMSDDVQARFGHRAENMLEAIAFAASGEEGADVVRAELESLGVLDALPVVGDGQIPANRGRNAGHSAELDKAVPTDRKGLDDEAQGDGTRSEPEGVPAKRKPGAPAE